MEKVKDEKFYQGPKWSKAKRNLCNQLTTDGHTWIRKCMREKELKITHQFDVWHFVKNIKKKLHKVGKNKSSENLQKWTKSISNHFGGPAQLAKGTKSCWVKNGSALYFMFKIYTNGELVNSLNKCEHRRLTKKEVKSKDWLSADPDEFKALQKIVTDKKILNDLKYLTKFSHTRILEIYHALYNKWAPKSQHFSNLGMITRSQLAIMDFNTGSELEHATTKAGKKDIMCVFQK